MPKDPSLSSTRPPNNAIVRRNKENLHTKRINRTQRHVPQKTKAFISSSISSFNSFKNHYLVEYNRKQVTFPTKSDTKSVSLMGKQVRYSPTSDAGLFLGWLVLQKTCYLISPNHIHLCTFNPPLYQSLPGLNLWEQS